MAPHNRYLAAHTNPNGAGDDRPTAKSIIHDTNTENTLYDKVVLLTGGSSGIGLKTALALSLTGAHIFLTARSATKAKTILSPLLQPDQYTVLEMHQDDLSSVRAAAEEFLRTSSQRCNILICNAGVMACPMERTADGFEMQLGVNHLSHFLLFQLVKEAMVVSSTPAFQSRVVMVASSGHRNSGVDLDDLMFDKGGREYQPFVAYGQSKTANVYMANEIERRFASKGVHGLSLHPGGIKTGLQKHVDPEIKKGWDTNPVSQKWSKSAEQGASTTVYAAVSPEWEGRGGMYLEDCDESVPFESGDPRSGIGYKPHLFDEEKATALWERSLELVGIEGKE